MQNFLAKKLKNLNHFTADIGPKLFDNSRNFRNFFCALWGLKPATVTRTTFVFAAQYSAKSFCPIRATFGPFSAKFFRNSRNFRLRNSPHLSVDAHPCGLHGDARRDAVRTHAHPIGHADAQRPIAEGLIEARVSGRAVLRADHELRKRAASGTAAPLCERIVVGGRGAPGLRKQIFSNEESGILEQPPDRIRNPELGKV